MMSCDSRSIGMAASLACEYTKAYVRWFPLLALVVTLIVASRLMLCQRIYYELLKKEAILGFHPISPAKDPLFLILMWCFFSACLHFFLEVYVTTQSLSASALKKIFIHSQQKQE